jgi:hypothetical protein
MKNSICTTSTETMDVLEETPGVWQTPAVEEVFQWLEGNLALMYAMKTDEERAAWFNAKKSGSYPQT